MIIGILGYARSGKNATADILKRRGPEKGLSFEEVAFADEVKRVTMRLFDFTEEQSWGILKDTIDTRYPREHVTSTAEPDICACCKTPTSQWSVKQCYLTPRYAQQTVGTEGARSCYPDIWADKAIAVARLLQEGGYSYRRVVGIRSDMGCPPMNVVIPDVRFINEVASIKRAGGKVYRVKRAGIDKPPHAHPSETEQAKISDDRLHGVLQNDSDLDHLEKEVVQHILGRML
jgi:hypothetical protein